MLHCVIIKIITATMTMMLKMTMTMMIMMVVVVMIILGDQEPVASSDARSIENML